MKEFKQLLKQKLNLMKKNGKKANGAHKEKFNELWNDLKLTRYHFLTLLMPAIKFIRCKNWIKLIILGLLKETTILQTLTVNKNIKQFWCELSF